MTWKIYEKTDKQIMYKELNEPNDEFYRQVLTIPKDLVEAIKNNET